MPDSGKSVYSVDVTSDPVLIRILGRASFQNSGCLHDFFKAMMSSGKSRFVMDFSTCTSMDSTFLGVLAGTAMQVRKLTPPGTLILTRIGPRNLELVRNLGLHKLLTVDETLPDPSLHQQQTPLVCGERSELESAKLVLEAHESLVAADEANRGKFQDVLTFLKNRVEQK